MKLKSWLKYFIYILLILLTVFLMNPILGSAHRNAQATFNLYLYYNIVFIFYGGIGLLLGLEHLVDEIKKEGIWAFNLPKIILIGLPSLYFSLALYICSIHNRFLQYTLLYPVSVLLRSSTNFISVFQLILGYTIITSFYKKIDEK